MIPNQVINFIIRKQKNGINIRKIKPSRGKTAKRHFPGRLLVATNICYKMMSPNYIL